MNIPFFVLKPGFVLFSVIISFVSLAYNIKRIC